jgi:hypothetical protein
MSLRTIDKYVFYNKAARRFDPVYWRREVLPSWITFDQNNTVLPYVVPAVPALGPISAMKQPYASVEGLDRNLGTPFEVRSIVFNDSTVGALAADFTVVIREVGEVRQLMNNPIHIRTFAGTAQLPALLREPYMFLSQHNLSVQMNKVAGGAVNARLYLCGAQYYPWSPEFLRFRKEKDELVGTLRKWIERRKYVTPFWATTDVSPVVIPANGTVDAFIKVGDDSHLEIFGHSAVRTSDNFMVEISEVKTKQTLMNGMITGINGVAPDVRLPTMYPTAYLVPAGYRLRLRFTDFSGVENRVHWTFFCRRLYVPFVQVKEVQKEFPLVLPTPADEPTPIVPRPI